MKITLIALVLTSLTSIAHADVFSDRAGLAAARAAQENERKLEQGLELGNQNFLAAMNRLQQKYSPINGTADCRDSSAEYATRSWKLMTYTLTGSGLTVNVLGYKRAMLEERGLFSCKVMLTNGLACVLSANYYRQDFGGVCYDGQGNRRELTVPLSTGK